MQARKQPCLASRAARSPRSPARHAIAAWTRVLALVPLLALACGEPATDTASVSLFVTDAPSDAFRAVNVTVKGITLLGGPQGQVTVFEGDETFDLLTLRDVSELFAVNDAVPAGLYSKIRLTLADDGLELVEDDGSGGQRLHYPRLPVDNQIELIPRPALRLAAGDAAGIEIDIDLDRSIHAHGDGNGKYGFRPVVLVRVMRDLLDGRLVRLNGWVTAIDLDSQSFSLCRLRRPLAWLHDVRTHGPHPRSADHRAELSGAGAREADFEIAEIEGMDRRHPWRRCVDVNLTGDASIFDVDGTPIRLGDVRERERAMVIGRVRPTRDRPIEMFASLVLMGPPGTFEHRVGMVASGLDTDGVFVLTLASGNGDLGVQVYPTTKIFERGGTLLGEDAILPDTRASATGVVLFSSQDPAVMNAAVLILDLDDSAPVPLHGTISWVNPEPTAGECQIGLDAGGQETGVAVSDATLVFVIDPTNSQSLIGDVEDLRPGDIADIYGRPGGADHPCYRARVIVAFQQAQP